MDARLIVIAHAQRVIALRDENARLAQTLAAYSSTLNRLDDILSETARRALAEAANGTLDPLAFIPAPTMNVEEL